MPTTPNAGLRYPDLTNAPNVPLDVGNLASDVDGKAHVTVANITARNALIKWTGLRAYVVSDKRIWLWDGAAWQYAGGAPPPITAVTILTGWTAGTNFAPGCYRDANGLISVVGGVTNNAGYTPPANTPVLTLPAGFWPTRDIAVIVMAPVAAGSILGGVYADGSIKFNVNNSVFVPTGTLHTVNFSFHPGFAGGALA